VLLAGGGWFVSARLQAAVHKAQEAQAAAERGEQEADRKRQELNEYLVYLNERLANLSIDQPIHLELLNEGLRLCEKFANEKEDDPDTRRQTATLYRSLGDLQHARRDRKKAADAYARALELLEQLTASFPDKAVYHNDLAIAYGKQAQFQETIGEHEQALATLRKAIAKQDRLTAGSSAPVNCRERAAELRLTLGTFLEEQKKPAEAEAAYRSALALLEPLAAERGASANTHQKMANTASTLAWLLVQSMPPEAERLFQKSLTELREARSLEPAHRQRMQVLWSGYTDLAAFYKARGRHAELTALAHQARGDFLSEPTLTYQAACFLADSVRVVANQKDLPAPQGDALVEEYAAAAVGLLEKAIQGGFADRARIQVNPELDPLRSRKDFGALMANLEQRYPNLSPERELGALQDMMASARNQYKYQMDGARTAAEFQRAEAVKPDLQAYAEKYLQLAQKRRDSWAAMEALVQVLESCQPDEAGPAVNVIRQKAVQLLEKDHWEKPEFQGVCLRFARATVPEMEKLLAEAAKRHPRREVRGVAEFTLAINLARSANKIRSTNPGRASELMRRAEEQLEKILKEYSNIQIGHASLGVYARHELDEVHYLSIGSMAREINGEELHGQYLRLSNYRGKVVVLDFWADWCGYCRQMHPREQDLVERYRNRPFVLLGVDCDDDRDAVCRAVARRGLSWSSWWDGGPDGGPIRRDWHVHAFPSIWVLDHKQVIRYRFGGLTGKELDDAVAQLIKEAEADQARAKAAAK
jgi:thiol-disulfide isomerase/thioredoxin